MSTTPASHPDELQTPAHVENSTDATRGQPLALRAQKRKAELEEALAKVPADDRRGGNDLVLALDTVNGLLTGDLENLSDATASALSRWLESTKHLAEVPTPVPTPH
jgi:hypothetical protein